MFRDSHIVIIMNFVIVPSVGIKRFVCLTEKSDLVNYEGCSK